MAFKMKGSPYPKSPYKNYKNPQDYKVFNFGNKPTPMKLHEEGHNPPQKDPAYEGGDYSWEDLAKMSKAKLKSMFPDAHEQIIKDLASRKKRTMTKTLKPKK
tara:strand:- start:864 stop:1169 length:306 start_codon:yes stop_codon:yes gene_type:complete